MKRRCGWSAEGRGAPVKVVWARGPAMTEACPRTEITAASQSWLEMFAVWKRVGGGDLWSVAAKDAEALALLEEEWEKERRDAEERRRSSGR